MKKILFIFILVIMGGSFARANTFSIHNPATSIAPGTNAVVHSNESLSTKSQFNKARKVYWGYLTDASGSIVGWWAYDNQSGALINYFY